MKESRLTETEIVFAIKKVEAGLSVVEEGREPGASDKTIQNWRERHGRLILGGSGRTSTTFRGASLRATERTRPL